ncbi:Predicted phosphoadenosine phosphosulfate sulfotransferase [Kluyvera cryocrescens]|uniref:Predicted phosphoadenosine phosphosulfate sulfotransferase n=1 Tax=Kluyvera cryocrescens TaxID=580 RepID=A0A485CJR2_KLUCR|nr:Predicted phosphoadenosine phosphosulfate sulfotransferase [Kluyvera cryocrescens]
MIYVCPWSKSRYPSPVLDATYDRIAWTLDNFSRTCVSFSGGKDSTVMLHLTAQMARARGKKNLRTVY